MNHTTGGKPSLQRLLVALKEARIKLESIEQSKSEPIAIIGYGCRFPGGANDPQAYWQLLHDGVDAIIKCPSDRWNVEAYYDPNPNTPGKIYTRHGGFLRQQIDQFDPQFFEISPKETMSLDPQQRLLLEVSWEALENAGLVRDKQTNKLTGVFIGISATDYSKVLMRSSDLTQIDSYFATGNTLNAAAGRISYKFGFQGPCMAIDTACSSSLVAVHMACQSLRNGECRQALAGGVNLILTPESTIALCQAKILSPEGRCKTFDASADGMARGEGCGVIVLKRFSDAVVDGDNILALIRGSAVNQDGPSSGFTVPNGPAQEALIRQALTNARIEPKQVSYLEAHGTGTSLGDPIELRALSAVLGAGRLPEQSLLVGSVKTNLGHLESASGIAGLLKVVLMLQHQEIPAHLHLNQPSPHLDWDKLPVKVPTEKMPWFSNGEPRIAGVSSFGLSGTNAHVVLEEAPLAKIPSALPNLERPLHLLTLSAKTVEALKQLSKRYEKHLAANPTLRLCDICFSANTGRMPFNHRLSVVASSITEMGEKLAAFSADQETTGSIIKGQVPNARKPKIAFLFTGQGSQYIGMARQLYDTQPTFRQTIDRCANVLQPYLEKPLLKLLYPENNEKNTLDETAYTQPALFAVEYALAQLWQSWGIVPSIVTGHSVGEYVAACIAGVFSLEDGLKLIAARGRLMQALCDKGDMLVLSADESKAASIIKPFAPDVSIAAINGPENVVISGKHQAIETIITTLSDEIKSKRLPVSHAFHSAMMEPMQTEFERVATGVNYAKPSIPLCSNVTGLLATDEIATPAYWVHHVRLPVRFAASIKTLYHQGYDVFVEIGPKPSLLGMARQCLPDEAGIWLPSLREGQDDWQQLLQSLGELYVHGVPIDWADFDKNYSRQKISLPTYPFQRQRYWIDTTLQSDTKTALLPKTSILNFLQEGETEQLTQQLKQGEQLSDEEVKLLPKLLGLLVKQHQQQVTADAIKEWLYQIEWQPQALFGLPPDYIPTPAEIGAQLKPYLASSNSITQVEFYGDLFPQLDVLSVGYILTAFQQMGWVWQLNQRVSTAQIAEQLGIVSRYQRLLGRLLEILAEEGSLRQIGEQWEVVEVPDRSEPLTQMTTLLAQYSAAKTELTLLARCGAQLAAVLRGKCEPLQLLFPDGDLTTATQLYQDSPSTQVMNTLVQQVILSAVERLPQGRGVRVLEIGAGTGGTTSYILPHLPTHQTDYVFTDISLLFTTQAQNNFQDYAFVRYQSLDIEQPPETQGFEKHQYDFVVGANVLHATKDLGETLAHVQSLLAPGGMLVLLECTTRQAWLDLTVGLMEGWWRFADLHLRPDYPLLSPEQWQTLLQQHGFTQVVSLSPVQECKTLQQAVIVAQTAKSSLPPLYKKEEQKSPLGTGRNWLIFADSLGVSQQLATHLQSRGDVCFLVFQGQTYKQVDRYTFRVNPTCREDFQQLLETVTANHQQNLRGIIHCWSLDAVGADTLTVADLGIATQQGCGSTLYLVQTLAKANFSNSPPLWLVTQGATPVVIQSHIINESFPIPNLAQSPLWGMGKVIALEHPELNCVLLDLDPQAKIDANAQALFAEIGSKTLETQIAFRDNVRFVARLVRSCPPEQPQSMTLRPDATYLITDGLGVLGLRVAQWMIKQGARHLVLLGRGGAPNQVQDILTKMEQAGVQVIVVSADLSRVTDIAKVFTEIKASMPSLQGIVHAAGVPGFQTLEELDWNAFEAVLRPKVLGTWVLHQLTQQMSLDFFVNFSSITSVCGSKGQSHYAAANHFLDIFSHYRRGQGLPGLTINWGPWAEDGMAANLENHNQNQLTEFGIDAITSEKGLQLLDALIGQVDAIQVGILPVNWSKFLQQFPSNQVPPFLSEVAQITTSNQSSTVIKRIDIKRQLEAASDEEHRQILTESLQTALARVLKMHPSQVDERQPLNTMGLDSLMALELRKRVGNELDIDIPISNLITDISVIELAKQLTQQLKVQSTSARRDDTLPPFTPMSRDEPVPLSFAQQEIWFFDHLVGSTVVDNMAIALRLEGQLHHDALAQSFQTLVQRHECLRTYFPIVNNCPAVQVSVINHQLFIINLQDLPPEEQALEAQRLINDDAQYPFDLSKDPLFRTTLLQLGAKSYVLLINMHHIIGDGWSNGILIRELSTLYEAFSQGKPSPLPPLPILQYVDFAHWQLQLLDEVVFDKQLSYWKQQLAGAPTLLELPIDHPRPPVQSTRGSSLFILLSPDLTARLKSLSQQAGTTLFMTLLSALATLLSRYSGQTDIVIGTLIANHRTQFEPLIGLFLTTLALRLNFEGNPPFDDVLQQTRRVALEAYAHSDIPFILLIKALQPKRTPSHLPLFQVMFDPQDLPMANLDLPGLNIEPLLQETSMVTYDLELMTEETEQGVVGTIRYNTDLFERATIERMIEHFQTLLESIVENPQQPIHGIPLFTEGEEQQFRKRCALSRSSVLSEPLSKTEKIYVAPRTPAEELLARIWAETLEVEKVGICDNFFELGGHSMLATQVMLRISERLSCELSPSLLFESQTIAGLSEHLSEVMDGIN